MLSRELWALIGMGFWESLYMTLIATIFSYVIGLPIGLTLVATDQNGIRPMPMLNKVLGIIVNILRSVPFLILMVFVRPLTRLIVGTTIGTEATIVPLVIAAAPFIGRMVESSIKEVGFGVIEAAHSMGATPWQIVTKVLVPEAKPSLIIGAAISITTVLSYSAMSGFIGGGGLGAIALNYGWSRQQFDVMFATVVILVIIVQVFQEVGMRMAKKLDKRNK